MGLIVILAQRQGRLKGGGAVATVMSNLDQSVILKNSD